MGFTLHLRVLSGILPVFLAAYAAVLLAPGLTDGLRLALNDIGGAIPPLAAGIVAIAASRVSSAKARTGWLLIGLGCLSWGGGEIVWTWYEVVLGSETPFPSWADVGYLAAVPLLMTGILVLTVPSSSAGRIRLGLDALAVVAAAGAVSWYFVLDPIYSASDLTTTEKVLSSAYPLSDLALLFALVVSLPRLMDDQAGHILAVFGIGLFAFLAADTGFAYLQTTDTYGTGSIVDMGWVLATCLFLLAAVMQYDWRADYADNRPSRLPVVSWFQLLPILLIPFMVGWPLITEIAGTPLGDSNAPTLGFILAFTVFVVLRQSVALLDSVAMNRRLVMSNATLEVRTELLSERLLQEQTAANRDWLTGALSRRGIQAELERITRAEPERRVALGLVDLDHLKIVNDRDGHAAGDQVLQLVATGLSIDGAIVGRYGGDEYLVLLPDASEAEVLAYLSIVDWRLGNLASRGGISTPGISSGFALYPEEATVPERLIELADQRMYLVKKEKRSDGPTADGNSMAA